MFDNTNKLRPNGVKVAGEGPAEQGPPQTVLHLAPMKMYGAQFYDERGRLQPIVVIEMGGRFYAPPNAVEWAERVRPVSKWMEKQLREQLSKQTPVNLPDQDAVDVLSDEGNDIGRRIAAEAEQRRTEG